MQYYWTYVGCDNATQAEIAEAFRSRQAELEAKAALVESGQSAPVVVLVEHSDSSPQWLIQSALYAPRATVKVEARADEILDALDLLVGELSQQIQEQANPPSSAAVRHTGLDACARLLDSFHRERLNGEFLTLLTPIIGSLHSHIRRELRTRQALGEIPLGLTSLHDISDQSLLTAWERYDRRPKQQPLDVWLLSVIEEAFNALTAPFAEQSPRQREAGTSTTTTTESRDARTVESVEQATEFDSAALAQTLSERTAVEPWDRLDIAGRQVRLDQMLQRLPRQQRHVLMLKAVDGFSFKEIADLQDRPLKEVEADFLAAKQEVRSMFTEIDYLDIEEKLTLEALERPRRSHRT